MKNIIRLNHSDFYIIQRALSPPSSNNKNGLTTTKNNILTQPPKSPISPSSNPSQNSTSPTPLKQEVINESQSNIIYSHTPSMSSIETGQDDKKITSQTKGGIRSYGADGSLLHRSGKKFLT